MNQHESLIRRLCEASEGSADLSREVREALSGTWSANEPCITTDLSAAWAEAERWGFYPLIDTLARGDGREYEVSLFLPDPSDFAPKGVAIARTPALALCAALLAAEGER